MASVLFPSAPWQATQRAFATIRPCVALPETSPPEKEQPYIIAKVATMGATNTAEVRIRTSLSSPYSKTKIVRRAWRHTVGCHRR